ncbi:hypothetical protein GCM10022200_21680 [Microbacterium awajiense]|uniref:Uncharacterized protein n=1 Tax=Microbacterium awajiense TaxID=415214 RepID=A0ABP7AR52_9MICO
MLRDTFCGPVDSDLAAAAAHLAHASAHLDELAFVARALPATTDWDSGAAREFHTRAVEWMGRVTSLRCLAETARIDTERARDASRWWADCV